MRPQIYGGKPVVIWRDSVFSLLARGLLGSLAPIFFHNDRMYFMPTRLAAAIAATVALASPASADWSANLINLGQSAPGADGSIACPAGGSFGTVWGTGTYTSDSSICTAAVHFGWIQQATGGQVDYRTVPGLNSYDGSAQNGVTSQPYGSWSLSFQITGARALTGGGARSIDWGTTLDGMGVAEQPGSSHGVICPPGGSTSATIWGSDVYTSDSPICIAATHRGVIDPVNGGPVTVTVLGGQPTYLGTGRNGVLSSDYPAWPRSFIVQ